MSPPTPPSLPFPNIPPTLEVTAAIQTLRVACQSWIEGIPGHQTMAVEWNVCQVASNPGLDAAFWSAFGVGVALGVCGLVIALSLFGLIRSLIELAVTVWRERRASAPK
jgi:hypothetical protein